MKRRQFVIGLSAGTALALSAPHWARGEEAIADKDGPLAEMVMGNANAPVTIIAYESLTCPHCADFEANTLPKLKKAYIDTGKVRFILRDFPFDQVSMRAHMMARCTGKERFFGTVTVLFRTQQNWSRAKSAQQLMDNLARIGRLAGLSRADFDACMKNEKLIRFIVRRIEEANKTYGVRSTPTFIINGKRAIIGAQPFERFESAIDPLIK